MNQQWTLDIAGRPLLHRHLCSVYDRRPFFCRAYGFPRDAYAVETGEVIVVRSLYHLYDGLELLEVVPGNDLKQQPASLSTRLGSGQYWGRLTSIEAILARVRCPAAGHTCAVALEVAKPFVGRQ